MSRRLLLAMALALMLIGWSEPFSRADAAPGAALVVNNASDKLFGTCDAAHCTLREALVASNATADVVETIQFDIPPSSQLCDAITHVCKIKIGIPALPEITAPVVIDGYSQPGAHPNTLAVGNDAALRIVLDGSATTDASGLTVSGGHSTIKGLVVIGFDNIGIGLNSGFNVLEGNWIGIAADGVTPTGNTVGVFATTGLNRIGGTTPAARNVLSGNIAYGIQIEDGSRISVEGNYIGTDAQGENAVGNLLGLGIYSAREITIGGTDKRARNVISGNYYGGIGMLQVSDSVIRNNHIGTSASGKLPLGNQGVGIQLVGDAPTDPDSDNYITRNRIAFNSEHGIGVRGSAFNNFISRNKIYENGALGINLGDDQVTFNDSSKDKDADEGPNHLQNFPVLKSAQSSGGTTTVSGILRAAAKQDYRLEFFSGACNPDSPIKYGEGKKYLGAVDVTTNARGKAQFTLTRNKRVASHTAITATATDLWGNTSEFSKCKSVQS